MEPREDPRQLHALRKHIDCLLDAGASIVGRDPVRISLDGHTLVVLEGMLISEDGHLDFVETLLQQQWDDPAARRAAMTVCLKLLGGASARVESACRQSSLGAHLDAAEPDLPDHEATEWALPRYGSCFRGV